MHVSSFALPICGKHTIGFFSLPSICDSLKVTLYGT